MQTLKKYVIHGGKPLYGKVEISGAKNAAVGIIPAALLVEGICRIENIPQISDVTLMLNILQELGASVRTVNRSTVEVDASAICNRPISYQAGRKIRASYYLLGALLGGNLMALAFSLPGGLLALAVMALLVRCPLLSLFGVSVAGAAAHNTGQILAAMAVLGSRAPLVYLPPLLLCSLVTGAVTGAASTLLVHRVPSFADIKS